MSNEIFYRQDGGVGPETSTPSEIFGNVIFSYTRAQALADGVLVDLVELAPTVCRQHFKYPIACTDTVFSIIENAPDLYGVVHDVLWMSRHGKIVDESTRLFEVIIGREAHTLKIICGPGDDAEPVLTIMLPEED